MLYATRDCLTELFDGSLKYLVRDKASQSLIATISQFGLKTVIISRSSAQDFRAEVANPISTTTGLSADFEVSALPSGILGSISESDEDKEFFALLANDLPASVLIPNILADRERLEVALVLQLQSMLHASTARTADLNTALALVRSENNQNRQVLQRMQDILWVTRSQKPQISVVMAVGRGSARFSRGTILAQRLVLPALGLAGFDLYISELAEDPGMLCTRLISLDDDTVVASWAISYDELKTGWLHHPLPFALDTTSRGVEISIHALSNASGAPHLALTNDQLAAEFSIRGVGVMDSVAALAMRLWTAFPGVRSESVTSACAAIAAKDIVEYALAPNTMKQVQLIQIYPANFELLQRWGDGSFLLHPLVNREVGAFLPSAIPSSARRVEATVAINDHATNDVQFAICAGQHQQSRTELDVESSGWVASSGWITVRSRLTKEKIALALPDDLSNEALDLYFFTRVPFGGSIDFAQATFLGVDIFVSLQRTALAPPEALLPKTTDLQPVQTEIEISYPADKFPRSHELQMNLQGDGFAAVMLSPADLDSAQKLPAARSDFAPVHTMRGHRLVVHPLVNQMMAASIDLYNLIASDSDVRFTEVVAEIGVGRHFNGVVEFRVSLIEQHYFEVPCSEEWLLALKGSDWRALRGEDERAEFVWVLDMPTSAYHLCLQTRIPNGGSVDFASPFFGNILVCYKGSARTEMEAPTAKEWFSDSDLVQEAKPK